MSRESTRSHLFGPRREKSRNSPSLEPKGVAGVAECALPDGMSGAPGPKTTSMTTLALPTTT
jgi:hypothetical protein